MSIVSASLVPTLPVNGIKFLNPALASANTLGTDVNGNIIVGSTASANYQGKLADGVVESGTNGNPYLAELQDDSTVSIDYNSRLCTIQIVVSGKATGADTILGSLLVNPPPNTQDYTTLLLNTTATFPLTAGEIPVPANVQQGMIASAYVDQSNQANNQALTWNWYYDDTANAIRLVYFTNQASLTCADGDTLYFYGTLVYQF